MGVAERDVGALVPHAVRDRHRREPHVDEQRDVAVAQVVHPDALQSRRVASPAHLVREEVLRHGEDPLVVPDLQLLEVLGHLLDEEFRHEDRPLGLRRLRVGHHVLSLDALVRLGDVEPRVLEVEVGRGERQELTLPDTAPVEQLERVERLRLVGDRVGELEVLVLRPELHLGPLLRPHARGRRARVLREPVKPNRMVEDRRELVVHRPQVHRGESLAVALPVSHEAILPADDVDGPDLVHAHRAEPGHYPLLDDALLD